MREGTYVELENGLHGIFTGYRGDGKARVICDASGMPEIHSVESNQMYAADGSPSEQLTRLYAIQQIVARQMRQSEDEPEGDEGQKEEGSGGLITRSELKKAFIPGRGVVSFILAKAGRAGLTQVKVMVKHPKTGKMYETTRWVKSGQEQSATERSAGRQKESEREVRVKTGGEYHNFLKPQPEQYAKIQGGDGDAMAKYLMDRFWKGPSKESEVYRNASGVKTEKESKKVGDFTKTSDFARILTRGKVEGYDLDDLVQEASMVMLEKQMSGALRDVPEEKFPAYIATTFKFIGNNLRRRSRIDKQTSDSIEEFANYIQDYSQNQEAEVIRKEHEQQIKGISEKAIQAGMDRFAGNKKAQDTFQRYLNGQKLSKIAEVTGQSLGAVKMTAKRALEATSGIIEKAGYAEGKQGLKDWMADYRRINEIQREKRERKIPAQKPTREEKKPESELPSTSSGHISKEGERAPEGKKMEIINDKYNGVKVLRREDGKFLLQTGDEISQRPFRTEEYANTIAKRISDENDRLDAYEASFKNQEG